MNKKKRKKKGIWIALAVFVILAAAAGIVWLLIRSGKIPAFGRFSGNNAGKENAVSSSIQTETAKRGSIRVTAQGSGAVEPVSSHAVTLEYDGVLEEISIEPGDMVSKGDILAVYDIESIDDAVDAKKEELDSTDEAIAQMSRSGADTVKAPVAGRVKRIFAHEGGCCCPHHRGKGRTCGAVGGRTYEDGGVHRQRGHHRRHGSYGGF